MKTTAQRLSEVYCRPKTDEWEEVLTWDEHLTKSLPIVSWDWAMDGKCYPISRNENHHTLKDRTEIPVTHFIDLLQDKIAQWRLEEDRLLWHSSINQYVISIGSKRYHVTSPPISNTVKVDVWSGDISITADGCKTYTDLLTLIKLIG